jgi:hypothetical protein
LFRVSTRTSSLICASDSRSFRRSLARRSYSSFFFFFARSISFTWRKTVWYFGFVTVLRFFPLPTFCLTVPTFFRSFTVLVVSGLMAEARMA